MTDKTLTKNQTTKLNKLTTKSGQIRYLAKLGWARGAIAKQVGCRYQMVRNILEGPVPKNPKDKV
jgi:hypothetical protein